MGAVLRVREYLFVTLGKAAGYDEFSGPAALLEFRQLEDGIYRLLLGVLDKAAGIDDKDVGRLRVLTEGDFSARQPAQDFLGVYKVL